jgi:hypothetical protein
MEISRVSETSIKLFRGINVELPIIIDAVIILMARILVYSAIKINANTPLLYSTLNPDTSSDSPSAKSNGVRFVSARLVINHTEAIKGSISIVDECWFIVIIVKSMVDEIIKALIRIRVILTS